MSGVIRSNTEINSFLYCQRKHYYSFREGLAPKGTARALNRGIVGHEAMERVYQEKQTGATKEMCLAAAYDVLNAAIMEQVDMADDFRRLKEVIKLYVYHYWDEPFKVIGIEGQLETLFPDSIDLYGLRYDLLVEGIDGKYKGQIGIIDHKFCYDWFTDKAITMNSQMLKYAGALRNEGIDVRFAMLNQIRYRKLKEDTAENLLRRAIVPLPGKRIKNVIKEHVKVSNKIAALSVLSPEEHFEESTMTLDKDSCTKCAFQPLCTLELNEQSSAYTKKALYGPNKYYQGYKDAEETDGSN